MGVWDDWKVTPGITELSRPRAHIDGAACYIDVGSSYPGGAEAAKGGASINLRLQQLQLVVKYNEEQFEAMLYPYMYSASSDNSWTHHLANSMF